MIRLLTVLFYLFLIIPTLAQEGDYFLSHFSHPGLNNDHEVFDLEQDENGIFYMAHKSGIFIFNGQTWDNIPFSTSVFAIERIGNEMYTAGPSGFNRFAKNDDYEWEFFPLHEHDLVKDILRMVAVDGTLYGMSTTSLYTFDLDSGETHIYSAPGSAEFVNLTTFEDEVLVLDANGLAYGIEGRQLQPTRKKIAANKLRFVNRQGESDNYIVGTVDNEIFLYRNGFREILNDFLDTKDREYLSQSEITSGQWVNDSLAAVSTLKGGVVFINPYARGKRKVQNIVNYQNDLPDNEVFALKLDNNGALWVIHEKGFTRIATEYPFRRYDHFAGLEGKLQNAYSHNGVLYVGSSQGLFYLKETAVYEKGQERYTTWITEESDSERKGFFNRLFSAKKTKTTRKARQAVRTTRKFHSVKHEFHDLDPINSKVFHMATVNGDLYAAGLDGLFRIENEKVNRLTDLPIKYFHYSPWRNKIFAVTYDGDIIGLVPGKGASSEEYLYTDVLDPIHYIFENKRGEIFLTGIHTLYLDKRGEELLRIPFENPFYEETFGVIQEDSVYLINESGVYHVNTDEGSTERIHGIDSPERLLRGAGDRIWMLGKSGWKAPGKQFGETSFRHLLAFDRIRFISETSDQRGLWVITENGVDDNALYQLLPQNAANWYQPNTLFLEEINTSDGKHSPHGRIVLDQEESNVNFVFRQPDYSGIMDTEYMYELSGEMEEISEWGAQNYNAKFSYLPAGEYRLRVKSRNALGQVSQLSDISFKVLAPYWKRTWFYALEFAIIALMLLISMRMKAMGYKYRLVSRLLALLTLITIIELIQALAESKFETETSPVFGFIIQVLMAIMILPVEEILRKYIFKEKHVKVFDIFTFRDKKAKPDLIDQSAVAGDEL